MIHKKMYTYRQNMEEYMKNQTGHIKAKNVKNLAYFLGYSQNVILIKIKNNPWG